MTGKACPIPLTTCPHVGSAIGAGPHISNMVDHEIFGGDAGVHPDGSVGVCVDIGVEDVVGPGVFSEDVVVGVDKEVGIVVGFGIGFGIGFGVGVGEGVGVVGG